MKVISAAACGLEVRTLLILLDGFGLVAKGCAMEWTVGHRVGNCGNLISNPKPETL